MGQTASSAPGLPPMRPQVVIVVLYGFSAVKAARQLNDVREVLMPLASSTLTMINLETDLSTYDIPDPLSMQVPIHTGGGHHDGFFLFRRERAHRQLTPSLIERSRQSRGEPLACFVCGSFLLCVCPCLPSHLLCPARR